MAITEGSRHHLHRRLEAVLGREEASTLMEHLPPVGWADVATKRDLDHLNSEVRSELRLLERDVRSELRVLDGKVDTLRAEILGATQGMVNRLLVQLLGAMLAFVTVVLLAARLG